jgi:hypothetical protein
MLILRYAHTIQQDFIVKTSFVLILRSFLGDRLTKQYVININISNVYYFLRIQRSNFQ